jgi:hypothetical protein
LRQRNVSDRVREVYAATATGPNPDLWPHEATNPEADGSRSRKPRKLRTLSCMREHRQGVDCGTAIAGELLEVIVRVVSALGHNKHRG